MKDQRLKQRLAEVESRIARETAEIVVNFEKLIARVDRLESGIGQMKLDWDSAQDALTKRLAKIRRAEQALSSSEDEADQPAAGGRSLRQHREAFLARQRRA